ncbi:GNAT family N-acetyltransferase [Leekyejoonella antrihumi]|uniref:GNAT family N-acetyltransferase n=1 Tax=Leekyejoonella antrihumi TaxID=1660198 RepID=A0A563DY45_9MICO|nr:GNAT family N-acetyltransferase [Leekyejoonella antrihumi]TWP34873.1 GNAT family N-acetyltransferase [Leekyejoonella antrihumi]
MTTTHDVRRVETHDELLALTDQDPFIRYDVPAGAYDNAWAVGRAVAFPRLRQSHCQLGLTVTGARDDVRALLAFVAGAMDLSDIAAVSVDRALRPDLVAAFADHPTYRIATGGDWEWMWTLAPPPRIPEEDRLIVLDDATDAADVTALNKVGNPSAESRPGEGASERWVGVRDAGTLVAAAAMQRTSGGIPHLTGITVAPSHRGQRLGLAMTAALTRYAVQAEGVCSLGMYSENAVARGLYTRLGYRVAHAWSSRLLVPAVQG